MIIIITQLPRDNNWYVIKNFEVAHLIIYQQVIYMVIKVNSI